MTYRVLIVAIFFLSLASSAFGLSTQIPVATNGLDQGEYVFSVATRTVTNGIAFRVAISKKAGAIPTNSNVGVCIVKRWGSGSEISPVKPEIKVTLKRVGHSWTADFVASPELLQTAGANFVFTEYVYFGAAEFYEIKLQDFAPPIRPQR